MLCDICCQQEPKYQQVNLIKVCSDVKCFLHAQRTIRDYKLTKWENIPTPMNVYKSTNSDFLAKNLVLYDEDALEFTQQSITFVNLIKMRREVQEGQEGFDFYGPQEVKYLLVQEEQKKDSGNIKKIQNKQYFHTILIIMPPIETNPQKQIIYILNDLNQLTSITLSQNNAEPLDLPVILEQQNKIVQKIISEDTNLENKNAYFNVQNAGMNILNALIKLEQNELNKDNLISTFQIVQFDTNQLDQIKKMTLEFIKL